MGERVAVGQVWKASHGAYVRVVGFMANGKLVKFEHMNWTDGDGMVRTFLAERSDVEYPFQSSLGGWRLIDDSDVNDDVGGGS